MPSLFLFLRDRVSLYAVQAGWPPSPCLCLSAKIVGLSGQSSINPIVKVSSSWNLLGADGAPRKLGCRCVSLHVCVLDSAPLARAQPGWRQAALSHPLVCLGSSLAHSLCLLFLLHVSQCLHSGRPWVIVHRRSLQGCYRRKTSPWEACCLNTWLEAGVGVGNVAGKAMRWGTRLESLGTGVLGLQSSQLHFCFLPLLSNSWQGRPGVGSVSQHSTLLPPFTEELQSSQRGQNGFFLRR